MSFDEFHLSFKSRRGALPTILLVDRGVCFYGLKALRAQQAGAAAILIADDIDEPLITVYSPDEENYRAEYIEDITIPSALISKSLGNSIKEALVSNGDIVEIKLDWREQVEYEFWTNSDYHCGRTCDSQLEFIKNFKGTAQLLEQYGYTRFTPHFMTWFCPQPFVLSKQCKSQCINHGRYCAPDLDIRQDCTLNSLYDGKDVMVQNLLQACLFKVANEGGKPWIWWDYVTDFSIRCQSKENYTKECAYNIIRSLGINLYKIDNCIGDPEADVENPVLEAELDANVNKKIPKPHFVRVLVLQNGKGIREAVTMLSTLLINNRQYRGKLEKGAVLKAICAGFRGTADDCLSEDYHLFHALDLPDIRTNRCLENNGGCWEDKIANLTACRDTFRGRECECPVVNGLKYIGDGYMHCESESSSLAKKKLCLQIRIPGEIVVWAIILGFGVVARAAVYAKYIILRHMESVIRVSMAEYPALNNKA